MTLGGDLGQGARATALGRGCDTIGGRSESPGGNILLFVELQGDIDGRHRQTDGAAPLSLWPLRCHRRHGGGGRGARHDRQLGHPGGVRAPDGSGRGREHLEDDRYDSRRALFRCEPARRGAARASRQTGPLVRAGAEQAQGRPHEARARVEDSRAGRQPGLDRMPGHRLTTGGGSYAGVGGSGRGWGGERGGGAALDARVGAEIQRLKTHGPLLAIGQQPFRKTALPPTIVADTLAVASDSGAIANRLRSKTTTSAKRPGARVPHFWSANPAQAFPDVYARNASPTETFGSGT